MKNVNICAIIYGCHMYAFAITERGLALYPYNLDLLADAVYYGSMSGKWDRCEYYANQLLSRPYGVWNWRAFTFMIDYYMDKASNFAESESNILDNFQSAVGLSIASQKMLENEERGYLAEYNAREAKARLYRSQADKADLKPEVRQQCLTMAQDEYEAAMAALERAINDEHIVAVQCSLRYADILFEQREYEKTIEVCDKAFSYGETQPSARMGYFIYLIALSKDAMLNEDKAFCDVDRVEECFDYYSAALKILDPDRHTYRKNIKLRVKNLEERSKIKSSIDFSNQNSNDDSLQSLLAMLQSNNE